MDISTYLTIPIIAITFIGVAAGEFPGLKMNRATIALVAAVLLVALGLIPASAARQAIDPNTLLLLFAMMVIAAHLRMAGFFGWLTGLVVRRVHSPRGLLAWVLLLAGLLAALFLNDTVVIVFTPLVLDVTRLLRRNPLPYLIGLAAAANIGSVATITGNPQNILIGVSAKIPFALFLGRLGPVAIVGLVLAWLILVGLYRAEFSGESWTEAEIPLSQPEIDRHLMQKCIVLSVVLFAGFLAGVSMPLFAILIAAALLISRRIRPEEVFAQVDWPLLVFFAGLFVVTGALEQSDAFQRIFLPFTSRAASSMALLAGITTLLSNLVSNVPAVLLLRPVVQEAAQPTRAWLVLAMASTLAGNLTLLGSVANLIVAEAAQAQGVKITFREYLRAGIPITILTILAGTLWLGFTPW
jgi:Na+/H+ antiporter NhaD/arsenite permease-like protein